MVVGVCWVDCSRRDLRRESWVVLVTEVVVVVALVLVRRVGRGLGQSRVIARDSGYLVPPSLLESDPIQEFPMNPPVFLSRPDQDLAYQVSRPLTAKACRPNP